MKLTKLLEIEAELQRFQKRLNQAIEKAKSDDKKIEYTNNYKDSKEVEKPHEERECLNCKESAALKRSATDLKQVLYSLNKD
jgi:hypothetical protein